MRLTDFDYTLPSELIAQEALAQRDSSRLMTLERSSGTIGETIFSEITNMLHPGDTLVLNDTRVIPARLHGVKDSGGRIEVFLVRRSNAAEEVWDCLLRCSKPPRPGIGITFPGGMSARILGRGDGECWEIAFDPADMFNEWLECHGAVPLPPYIRRKPSDDDRSRYQTVFACNGGAVAAPTAGLHVTPELLAAIRSKGVAVTPITLHVGLGTFMPVRCEDLSKHRMHCESYQIPQATADLIRMTRENGGKVVALGTTTTRALEHATQPDGTVQSGAGEADIFIAPGYRFRVVDAIITNFHLPMSTLLMLVAAFAGKDMLFHAYEEAVRRRFRFYSYGDAMFIY